LSRVSQQCQFLLRGQPVEDRDAGFRIVRSGTDVLLDEVSEQVKARPEQASFGFGKHPVAVFHTPHGKPLPCSPSS
jgi:hypothetical protein